MRKFTRVLFFFCLLIVTDRLSAQPRKFVVGLERGDEIQADKVRLRAPAFGAAYIEADNQRFEFHEVAYYRNEQGHFEKLADPQSGKQTFFRRETDGSKISAYSRMQTTMTYGSAPGAVAPIMQTQRLDYYSMERGPLKKMTFSNLRSDLRGHAGSMETLRSVKGLRVVTGLVYAAGAGMAIAGISNGLGKSRDGSGGGGGVPPLFIAGVVTLAVPSLVFQPIKRNKMTQAVMVYNQ